MPPFEFVRAALESRLARGVAEPVSTQIADSIWLAVVEGILTTGERLPTSRELAISLGVNPRSVDRAYGDLEARGVVAIQPGEGIFISLRPPPEQEMERHRRFAKLCRETYDAAHDLDFSLDELIEALTDFRSIERGDPQ